MAQIKPDDQTICIPSTNLEINSVLLSSSGPWGYNVGTKTLTIPDINIALKRPYWDNESGNDTSFLAFEQVDGSLNYFVKRVHARGNTDQQSQSFQNRGVGIEIIHSSENGNVMPAEPNDILDINGAAERKYPNYCAYLWFDDTLGKFTHWWKPISSNSGSWKYIKTGYNTLIVDGKGGGNFTKLSDAYTYLNSLLSISGNPYAAGDLAPDDDNFWTIYIYNVVTETVRIDAQDFINVIFMPGSQLYVDSQTAVNVMFDGLASSPIRGTTGKFSAVWTAMQRNSADDSVSSPSFLLNTDAYQIVGVSRNTNIPANRSSVVSIEGMKDISLCGINICCLRGTSDMVGNAVRISGALSDSVDFARRNVTIKDCNISIASDLTTSFSSGSCIYVNNSDGVVYIDDCFLAHYGGATNNSGAGITVLPSGSPSDPFLQRVIINECIVRAPLGAETNAFEIIFAGSNACIVYSYNSVFEAYGQNNTGFNARAASLRDNCVFQKCQFRIVKWTTDGALPNALSTTASSQCVLADIPNARQAIFDECSFSGETAVSTGITLLPGTTWADTKVVLNKCTVRGGLASVASTTGTTGTTKRFFGTSFEGAIAGTPFGCAAATSTTGTNYLV